MGGTLESIEVHRGQVFHAGIVSPIHWPTRGWYNTGVDSYLKAQLKQVLGYRAPTGVDDAGQVSTTASTSTCFARVETRSREVPIYGGVENRTDHMIIVDSDFPLTELQALSAQYFLPFDPDTARRAKVAKVCIGEDGSVDHWEIQT